MAEKVKLIYRGKAYEFPVVRGTEGEEAVDEILNRTPSPPSKYQASLAPQIDQVVLKALSKAPEARHGSALEFSADLKQAILEQDGCASRSAAVPSSTIDTEIDTGEGE